MRAQSRPGFTLIELLVVIAIIAILAALLFPVFNRAREGARLTACMSNMHSIFLAVSQYRDDNNGIYPNMLLGYAENANGTPYTGSGTPVTADRLVHGLLYHYVKDLQVFRCPDNPKQNPVAVNLAAFPASSQYQPSPVTPASMGFDPTFTGPLYFYTMDSYDITPILDLNGKTNGQFQVVFSRRWTNGSGVTDAPNQMRYRNPPPDRTVITWCNYHVAIAGGDKSPVLRLSGTTKPLDFKQMVNMGWNIGP